MLGIGNYFYRLLPANPILVRVVSMASKRVRDLAARCVYLGLLIGVVVIAFVSGKGTANTSLDDLAAVSEDIFKSMSFLQLALVALLAPIFTAGAITQEKDSQTYDILLSTPLTNAQIVLGTLMSRLFFIVALLVSGIPIFSITQIFGGVAIHDIVISCTIAAATACVSGALAVAIATFKVGTRRTIFSFYMLSVVYMVGVYLLDRLDFFHVRILDPQTGLPGNLSETSWLAGIHPFLALQTLFPNYRPPDATLLPANLKFWPVEWALTRPATFFPSFMLFLSVVLVLPSIILMRRMAQSSFTVSQLIVKVIPLSFLRKERPPRTVWNNPIAWREARTKASAARASVLRYSFITLGLAGAIVVWFLYAFESSTGPSYEMIQPGSFNSANHAITLFTSDGQTSLAAGLTPDLSLTLDGNPVNSSDVDAVLAGRYKVANKSMTRLGSGNRAVMMLTTLNLTSFTGRITRSEAHGYLLGGILVEVAVILLIVTNAAASTVTREREDGTLDLLLTTPITSRYYLWGKLAGLVGFMLPLVAVPVLSAAIFVVHDLLRMFSGSDPSLRWVVLPEGVILMPLVLVVMVAFATIVGMQMSLRNRTTVRAVMSSLGLVVGAIAALGWCGYFTLDSKIGEPSMAVAAFSPLTVIATLVSPESFGGKLGEAGDLDSFGSARFTLVIFVLIATAAYSGLIYAMYKSMVKNFDMTIRRQSR